jgi:hypothetical protein
MAQTTRKPRTARRTGPDAAARREQALRRLGTRTPRCQVCGEADPIVLTGTTPDILCATCRQQVQGRSGIEQHHVAGRHNDPLTVPVDANDHRRLSDAQRDWPPPTLRNPEQSPLRRAAAALRGFLDWVRLMVDRLLGWIPAFLEGLDDVLQATWGPRWWEHQLPSLGGS